jgi:hypothetical protein
LRLCHVPYSSLASVPVSPSLAFATVANIETGNCRNRHGQSDQHEKGVSCMARPPLCCEPLEMATQKGAPRRRQRGATQCTVPADTRAAAPIEDNRRRTMGSFTTSIVGKLFTTGPSSLVEASAHHRYRQSSRASAHLRWLVGKHTLETSD